MVQLSTVSLQVKPSLTKAVYSLRFLQCLCTEKYIYTNIHYPPSNSDDQLPLDPVNRLTVYKLTCALQTNTNSSNFWAHCVCMCVCLFVRSLGLVSFDKGPMILQRARERTCGYRDNSGRDSAVQSSKNSCCNHRGRVCACVCAWYTVKCEKYIF